MRLVFVLSLSALAGCTCIDPSQPARYLCVPDAGRAEQCPGGWRCALEGFCVDPDQGAPLQCGSSTDCTGGWICGLAGTCLDPASRVAHPCSNEGQCTGGFHCGALGFCYDRADAGAIVCRPSPEADCADQWRCGLERTCHPLDAGAAYACAADDDCEARWRCGPDLACVDATADALRTTPDSGSLLGVRVNPTLPGQSPTQVSVNLNSSADSCAGKADRFTATLAYGARLTKYVLYPSGYPFNCATDGGKPSLAMSEQREAQLPSAPVSLLDLGQTTLAALDDGGLWAIDSMPLTPPSRRPLAPPFPVRGLKARPTLGARTPEAAIFNAQSAGWYDGTSFYTAPVLTTPDGGPAQISDVELEVLPGRGGNLFAATDQGLFLSDQLVPGGPFSPWRLVFTECKVKPIRAVQLLSGDPSRQLVVLLEDPEARASRPMRLTAQGTPPSNLCYGPLSGSSSSTLVAGSPGECPVGGAIASAQFAVALSDGGWDAVVSEPVGDAGVRLRTCGGFGFEGQGVPDGPMSFGVTLSSSHSDVLASADRSGALWVLGDKADRLAFMPVTLSAVPAAVGGRVDSAKAYVAPQVLDARAATVVSVGERLFRRQQPQGYVPFGLGTSVGILAPVRGDPMWMMGHFTGFSSDAFAVTFDVPDAQQVIAWVPAPLSPPYHAAVARSAGKTTVVVSGRDVLLHADVTEFDVGDRLPPLMSLSERPQLKFGATPLPSGTITSLVALPAGGQPQSAYALGYLVANGRVFRFKADNPVVFRTDEVLVEPNEALFVWADGPRARVGFASGRVYGLPSRALLAGALPGGERPLQFESVCGHTFALSAQGLYRLVVGPDSPLGAWQKVALESDDAGVPLQGALLYGDDTSLLVHRARGYVDELKGLECAP
ncbi:MAG: hypothetical protein IPJ65_31845 [Archangiaceae bacterium]|nr:hypothetical protein [Archangiaceae bacterium]